MPRTTPTAASACIGNSKRNGKGTPTKAKKMTMTYFMKVSVRPYNLFY